MELLLGLVVPAVGVAALRVTDVTMNVFRTVFTIQGRKHLAALFAGLEAAAWLAAAGIALSDLSAPRAAGFVGGVVIGTWLGSWVIERLRLGMVTVRAYADASLDPDVGLRMAKGIHAIGFGATAFDGYGYRGPVQMVLATVKRRESDRVVAAIVATAPHAFVSVDNELRHTRTMGRV